MVMKWRELGKPLFLIPKDCKERILTSSMDQEVKLNYLKWLTQGVEIDMFELLSLLILYARGSLEDRLSVLFMLYCYEDDESMQQDEFKFMLDKLSTSVGSILSVKKTVLLEMVKTAESKLVPDREQINKKDFVMAMMIAMREFTVRLKDITRAIDVFNANIRKEKLPDYLRPGSNFLGKFQVEAYVSYRRIISQDLFSRDTIFPVVKSNFEMSGRGDETPRTRPANQENRASSSKPRRVIKQHTQNSQENAGASQEEFEPDQSASTSNETFSNHLTLYNTNYAYRIKTHSIYDRNK